MSLYDDARRFVLTYYCRPVASTRLVFSDTLVYNFTVAVAHTYFVGNGEYLVHNQCDDVINKIAGTEGLVHSFDSHATQWFGRRVSKETHLGKWQNLIERAAQSSQVFDWSTRGSQTTAHLARIDGKYFVVQFFKEGDRAGELATAFVPRSDQLTAMLKALGK